MKNLKTLFIALIIPFIVGLLVGYIVPNKILSKDITSEQAKAKIQDFLKMNGMDYKIVSIDGYDKGIYKAMVGTPQGEMPAFITKTGKSLSFSMIDLDSFSAPATNVESNTTAQTQEVEVKNEKPVVELFVMSHCPYGTQIEKGILPVLETLGDKIDFQLKFVNYAMHGQKEIDEQLNQYCIDKLYPAKLNSYLSCFLDKGDGASCISSQGLSSSGIASCVSEADKEFKISESYADKSTWKGSYPLFAVHNSENVKYGVGGSPTLVINGKTTSSGRSSSALLATICSAFENKPEECNKELSSENPSPGFGYTASGSTTDASCN